MDDVGRMRCMISDEYGERTKQNSCNELEVGFVKKNVGGF